MARTNRRTLVTLLMPASLAALVVAAGGCAAGGARGAPWTILCLEIPDPQQAQQMDAIAESLRQTPGIRARDVYVVHDDEGAARLYYGVYTRRTDPRTRKRTMPKRMREDLSLIRLLGDAGRRYFGRALAVRKPVPDVGDPAWALKNVPPPAKYSLQVAVFEATDELIDFKSTAVEYCTELRKRGYEAYYHHASASSMVTVGVFGPEVIEFKPDGHSYYSQRIVDMRRDPLLKYNLVNGAVVRVRSDEGKMVPILSLLVEIPRPPAASLP
ncbi:MAG: hypothetical protein ACE5EX_04610 [Phycisphaerae bacterium]